MGKVLIAGMGNILRRDDGFGVEVARRLTAHPILPASVKVVEVGIGGIHLVQELMDGYDTLIILDAVEQNSEPGTVHVLAAEVPDLDTWSDAEKSDFLADIHYATPSKALILAKALDILPPQVFIIGCQPSDATNLGLGLSKIVEQAAAKTMGEIEKIIQRYG